jgi:hypothetical protein
MVDPECEGAQCLGELFAFLVKYPGPSRVVGDDLYHRFR